MAEPASVIYFDTFMNAIPDYKAGVVRGSFGRFDPTGWDMSNAEIKKVCDFVIPSLHFMQQAAFFEAVAKGMATRDKILSSHYNEMQLLFRQGI